MKLIKLIPALIVAFAIMSAPVAKAEDAVKKTDAAPVAKVEKAADAKADAKMDGMDHMSGMDKKECEHCKKGMKCKDCKKGKECKNCKEMKAKKCKHCDKDKHEKESKEEEAKEGEKTKN